MFTLILNVRGDKKNYRIRPKSTRIYPPLNQLQDIKKCIANQCNFYISSINAPYPHDIDFDPKNKKRPNEKPKNYRDKDGSNPIIFSDLFRQGYNPPKEYNDQSRSKQTIQIQGSCG